MFDCICAYQKLVTQTTVTSIALQMIALNYLIDLIQTKITEVILIYIAQEVGSN